MFQLLPTWLARWLGLASGGEPTAAHQNSAASDPAARRPAGGAPAAEAPTDVPESWNAATAVELISRLMDLTSTVASEVQEHSGHIESISTELSGVKQGDSAAVAAVVCKLLVINQETQRRLERAELKLQAQQRQLQDVSTAARMDGLTGLVNRRALDEALRRCVADFQRKGRPATLLILDVDHFKQFNDTHGHVAGDQALKHVADVLRSQSRDTDIVARFGGEEFVVIYSGAPLSAVKQRAEKLRAAIGAKPIPVEDAELHVATSAGLAELAEDDDEQQWLKRADAALYAAKSDGRNCLFWHEGNQPLRFDLPVEAEQGRGAEERPAGDRRRISTELAGEAFSDPTFVPSVSRRIAEWRRGGAAFSVILARLDRMEDLMQQHGAEFRPTALKALTQLARASLRDMDQPTRWTTDGLAVLIPGARISDAAIVGRRLLDAIERCELPLPGGGIELSLSVGAAEVLEGNDAQRLLERALLALDAARRSGGGKICLHDGLQPIAAPLHRVASL